MRCQPEFTLVHIRWERSRRRDERDMGRAQFLSEFKEYLPVILKKAGKDLLQHGL